MADDFAELRTKLQGLKGPALQKTQRKALKGVGRYVKSVLQFSTPVKAGTEGGELEPGELRDSIKARISVPLDEAIVQGKEAKVVIGPTGYKRKFIAHDVEYGHGSTPAHPFIRPVRDATEKQAKEIYQQSVTADVKKAME